MSRRRLETILAYVTVGALVIYAPVETTYSWSGGLGNPYYLIDVVAIGLLVAGVIRSLRARPRSAPALLAVGWAWAASNFWRALFDRIGLLRSGGKLDYGSLELRFVGAEEMVALLCLACGIGLVLRGGDA